MVTLSIINTSIVFKPWNCYQTKPRTDKCQCSRLIQSYINTKMSFSEEDNIGDHLEDDVVKEALESGQDLRDYSKYE